LFSQAARRAPGVLGDLGNVVLSPESYWLAEMRNGRQELTPEAEIVDVRFTKSVIASKAAFTYDEAQIRKDDP
jgi:hypothetical protein